MEFTINDGKSGTWSTMGCWYTTVRSFSLLCLLQFCSTLLFRFLVDKYSDLYYDSTLLFEAVKKATEGESGEHSTSQSQSQPQQNIQLTSQQHTFQVQQVPPSMSTRSHHTPRRDLPVDYGMSPAVHMRDQSPHRPTGVNPYPPSPAGMNMNMGMNMRGPPGGVPYPGSGGGGPPFSQPGNQFMGGDLTTAGSPMRMGGGSNIGMGGGLRPGMGGMPAAGMPLGSSIIGGIGGSGMAGMGAHGMGGMSAPVMGGMGGMGASGMGNMAGMGGGGMMGGMSGMGGMGTGIGGNMTMAGPNMGMGMGMVNMGVDHGGMGIGMSPRAMRGIPDDFSGIH